MMTPDVGPARPGLELFDELRRSQDVWIDRTEEAQALAEAIRTSASRIVVLVGPERAGKTELVRRWLTPMLASDRTVVYRDARDGRAPDEDLPPRSVVFWDSFEACLTDDAVEDGSLVTELSRVAGRSGARLVLVVRDEWASRLFQCAGTMPDLVSDLHEVPVLSSDRAVRAIQRVAPRYGIAVSSDVLQALADDLVALPPGGTFGSELIATLLFAFSRLGGRSREVTRDDYVAGGGLNGLLERHLDVVFEAAPVDADPQVAWAVLQESARSGAARDELAQIAHRFEVPDGLPLQVLRWLEEDRHVLGRRPDGGLVLVPSQLALALESRARRDGLLNEQVHGVLRQGVRQFADSESLLSPYAFQRVHAARTAVSVTEDEAQLMLRCGLAYARLAPAGAIDYWLGRLRAVASKLDVLFDATFDPTPGVRRRAAERLGAFDLPDVRNQLRTLALRDPAPDVRAAAVGSLDAVKDGDLQRFLLKEVSDGTSACRVQAIEAVRIFPNPEVVAALVSIVRGNAAGRDLEARRAAIHVLGMQNSVPAAEALLDIAARDEDREDRNAAMEALASMTGQEPVERVLAALRRLRHDVRAMQVSLSLKSTVATGLYAVLAVALVLANGALHGLLSIVLERRRTGILLLVGEGIGVGLLGLGVEVIGVLVLIGTLVAGMVLPLRILLRERLDRQPQSRFRRVLAFVLFAACAVSVFLYLHGLGAMAGKRLARGLVAFGVELLALLFFVTAAYLVKEYAGYSDVGLVPQCFALLRVVGGLLALYSYSMGVGTVALDAFLLRDRRFRLRNIDAIYARLLSNPVASEAVFRAVMDSSPLAARWGRDVASRFADHMQGWLLGRWQTADPDARRAIFAMVARKPDASAVDFLDAAAPALGWRARLQAAWARVSLLPNPVIAVIAAIGLGQMAAGYVVVTAAVDPPDLARRIAAHGADPSAERLRALERLETLARQRNDSQLAERATEAIAGLLVDSSNQDAAMDRLRRIGTPDAVSHLSRFVRNPRIQLRGQSRPVAEALAPSLKARLAAIDVLKSMAGSQPEALTALLVLGGNIQAVREIAPDLKQAAQAAVDSVDSLVKAEYFLNENNYEAALANATTILDSPSTDSGRKERAERVRGAVHVRQYTLEAFNAANGGDYETARDCLDLAVAAHPRESQGEDLATVGLNISFGLHEYLAPGDPAMYREVNRVLRTVLPLATRDETRRSLEENLVESNLTTGGYDQALAGALKLLEDPLGVNMTLNMKFFVAAALYMKGDAAAGREAIDDLDAFQRANPTRDRNTWSYSGTRSYIRNARVSNQVKSLLLGTIARIEAKTGLR